MSNEYEFSFYRRERMPHLIRRPWWDIFGRDSIGWKEGWERHSCRLTEDEAKYVEKATTSSGVIGKIMQMGGNAIGLVQLEAVQKPTEYIKTEARNCTAHQDFNNESWVSPVDAAPTRAD